MPTKNVTTFASLIAGFVICLFLGLLYQRDSAGSTGGQIFMIAAVFLTGIGTLVGCLMARAFITLPGEFHFDADGEPVPPDSLTSAFFSGIWYGGFGVVGIGWFFCGIPSYIFLAQILKIGF